MKNFRARFVFAMAVAFAALFSAAVVSYRETIQHQATEQLPLDTSATTYRPIIRTSLVFSDIAAEAMCRMCAQYFCQDG